MVSSFYFMSDRLVFADNLAVNLPSQNTSASDNTLIPSQNTSAGDNVSVNPSSISDHSGENNSIGIQNPLKNINSIPQLIGAVLKFVVNLLSIAGALYIIWSGFMFVKAQGNEKELEAAKKSFVNAIIGMAIILGAWGLAQVIAKTIDSVTGVQSGFGTVLGG